MAALDVPGATASAAPAPAGCIVFVRQLFKDQGTNQICIVRADGSGFARLGHPAPCREPVPRH